jgi:hypothetical protein
VLTVTDTDFGAHRWDIDAHAARRIRAPTSGRSASSSRRATRTLDSDRDPHERRRVARRLERERSATGRNTSNGRQHAAGLPNVEANNIDLAAYCIGRTTDECGNIGARAPPPGLGRNEFSTI